ncbi:MAG: hypothetical protein A4E28_00704 [Methanocella sp. PtaU1.Bin125]|nr:MAG: hypothetical protein A4E28_00704 [Methanocella sp. PtaU1.Bin125]
MSKKAISISLICMSIMLAVIISGCTLMASPYATLAPSPTPQVNTTAGDIPQAFDFNRAHWFEWSEALYMGAGSQSPSAVSDFRIEYGNEIYNGSGARHCRLHVSTDNGNSLYDLDYYYDIANRRILYAKSVNTVQSGLSERVETFEAPRGDSDTSGDAAKAVTNVRRFDPYLKNDSWAGGRPVGDETITIEKGTYDCKKFETTEGATGILTYWWHPEAPMRLRSISAETKPGEEARFVIELKDWG